jgi:hypothetical protein
MQITQKQSVEVLHSKLPAVLVETRWYIVLLIDIFGFQLFDYRSDIILFRVSSLLIYAKPSAYHVIFPVINLALH